MVATARNFRDLLEIAAANYPPRCGVEVFGGLTADSTSNSSKGAKSRNRPWRRHPAHDVFVHCDDRGEEALFA